MKYCNIIKTNFHQAGVSIYVSLLLNHIHRGNIYCTIKMSLILINE